MLPYTSFGYTSDAPPNVPLFVDHAHGGRDITGALSGRGAEWGYIAHIRGAGGFSRTRMWHKSGHTWGDHYYYQRGATLAGGNHLYVGGYVSWERRIDMGPKDNGDGWWRSGPSPPG